MSPAVMAFATEEEVALRAPADFAALCPFDQTLAAGSDGYFLAGDRWTLRSGAVDFAAQGVAPGQIVRLRLATGPLPAPGELFVAADSRVGALTLRRLGQRAGVGQPPAGSGGLQEVDFLVITLGPQLQASSQDIARRVGLVAPDGSLREPGADATAVRELTVVDALRRLYEAAGGRPDAGVDGLAARAARLREEYEERLGRLVGLGEAGSVADDPSRGTRYQTRLSR